jgi:hypothetical protein
VRHASLCVVEVLVDKLDASLSVHVALAGIQINSTTHVVGGLAQVTVGGERHDSDNSGDADATVEGLADVGEIGGGHCVVLGWNRMECGLVS